MLKAIAFVDPGICDAMAGRFKDCGIDRGRITFAGPIKTHRAHLESHSQADLMLDSFPYAGTTTTCESLWMGVPVVTLEGVTHCARVGSSLLQSIGLPQLVARSVDEYVAIAVGMAANPSTLVSLSQEMRSRMLASSLMDLPGFMKRFETALLYSARNVAAGSTLEARHAGARQAAAETIPSSAITPP